MSNFVARGRTSARTQSESGASQRANSSIEEDQTNTSVPSNNSSTSTEAPYRVIDQSDWTQVTTC
mgnify:CR=1 FL=1